ncbi:winged helix-turn-helix domain-containing protein [Streptomyces viridiviolaceus]
MTTSVSTSAHIREEEGSAVAAFSPRELMARIRSLLRRSARARPAPGPHDGWHDSPAGALMTAGVVTFHPGRHEVRVHGRTITCTPGEFRLLEILASRPGQVFTRAQILERLHGFDGYATTRTVDVQVMNLRRKIEADPRRPRSLMTVYGVGHKPADGEPPSDAGAGTEAAGGTGTGHATGTGTGHGTGTGTGSRGGRRGR